MPILGAMKRHPSGLAARVWLTLLWAVLACGDGSTPAPTLDEAEAERLEMLGYLEYSPEATEGPSGVVVHDAARSAVERLLVSYPSLARAELLDAQGSVLRSWQSDVANAKWERARVSPNGELWVLAKEKRDGRRTRALLRLAADGTLLARAWIGIHHDLIWLPDGRTATLSRNRRVIPDLFDGGPATDNGIALLSATGDLLEEHSLWDLLATHPDRVPFEVPTDESGAASPDIFHANAIDWPRREDLPEGHPLRGANRILVTIRNQDSIAVFDWASAEVIWGWGRGILSKPHDASLLANGNILVFDNRPEDDASRIVELDPVTGEIVWQYRAPASERFHSGTRGTVQRLANGNTLISESNHGRAFEVTSGGEIVWDYRTPHRTEKGRTAVLRIESLPASTLGP
jgi:hypothetical protein